MFVRVRIRAMYFQVPMSFQCHMSQRSNISRWDPGLGSASQAKKRCTKKVLWMSMNHIGTCATGSVVSANCSASSRSLQLSFYFHALFFKPSLGETLSCVCWGHHVEGSTLWLKVPNDLVAPGAGGPELSALGNGLEAWTRHMWVAYDDTEWYFIIAY